MVAILVLLLCIYLAPIDSVSLLNEDGHLRVFFPRNSFVTNTTLTHTNTPRSGHNTIVPGNDHIVCYGGSTQTAQVTWHNSNGGQLLVCHDHSGLVLCGDCGGRCRHNGAVGVDPQDSEHTDIHMYTNSTAYMNQDLECRVSGSQAAFIGVYLVNGGQFVTSLSNITVQIIQHLGHCTSHIKFDEINNSTVIMVSNSSCNMSLPP